MLQTDSAARLMAAVAFLGSIFTMATAATLEVGAGKTYTTIQAAIDAAAPGDTIEVAAGLYELTAQIDVEKPVILLGPQSDVDPRPMVNSATRFMILRLMVCYWAISMARSLSCPLM